MIIKKIFQILAGIIFISIILLTQACNDQNSTAIEGRLYVTGNEPFTHLAIETPANEVYILKYPKELKAELWENQGKVLEVKCKEIQKFEKFNTATLIKYKISQNQSFEYSN